VLGDVGAVGLPLASAPSVIDRCLGFVGHCVGTANISSCAPDVPLFIWRCTRRGHCHKNGRCPRSGHVMKIFHNREITFLTYCCSCATRLTIRPSSFSGHCICHYMINKMRSILIYFRKKYFNINHYIVSTQVIINSSHVHRSCYYIKFIVISII
jgi:hypothetical protein